MWKIPLWVTSLVLWATVVVAQPAGPVGPQASITCPMGATLIETTDNAPAIVWAAANGTVFCMEAGTHTLTEPIQMRQDQELWGQYGAILEGAAVVQGFDEDSAAIVRAWGCGAVCSGGLIKNLVIRNFATKQCIGIYGTGENADDWVVDHNELSGCRYGINIGYNDNTQVTFNFIHHNNDLTNQAFTGGYGGNVTTNALFEDNEISYNGPNQKLITSDGSIFRRNFIHHSEQGVWYDGDHINGLITANLIEDVGDNGIFYEVSASGTITSNIIRRAGGIGIFVSTSRDMTINNNLIEYSWRGIAYFVNCGNVHIPDEPYVGAIGWDLRNNTATGNTVVIGSLANSLANYITYNSCTAMQLEPYLDGTKNLFFVGTTYTAPEAELATSFWVWGDPSLDFTEWQAGGQDESGSLSPYGVPPPPPPPTVDTRSPIVTLVVTRSGKSLNFTIYTTATDDTKVQSFRLTDTFNGVTKQLSTAPGELVLKLSRGLHDFVAQAWDAAGNTAEARVVVTVTR